MPTARDDIFATIRRSLGVAGSEQIRREIVADRLQRAPRGVIPERGRDDGPERLATFRREAEAAFATVAEVGPSADVPGAVADYLRSHNLPATVRMGADPRFAKMPWSETALEVSQGRSEGADLNAVSHAFGGVAESGTLVMVSGPESPSTLNFLPDNHIVVLVREGYRGRLRNGVRPRPRYVWQGRDAAHRQLHHRPVPLRRHRADAFTGRARAASAAHCHRAWRRVCLAELKRGILSVSAALGK